MIHRNAQFLAVIDNDTKVAILDSIAVRNEITVEEAYAEVTGQEAENLLDYLVGSVRGATSILMQRRGM